MKNIKNKIIELNNTLIIDAFDESIDIINYLEDTLRENIYKDEELLEYKKEPLFLDINEDIKKSIVNALLIINKNVNNVKVYLDDKRKTPIGYIRAFWPEDVTAYIENLDVSELSLDHDLGDDVHGTGYDVVCYIEEKVYFTDFIAPKMTVHSDNSSAKAKMMLGINNIKKNKNAEENIQNRLT